MLEKFGNERCIFLNVSFCIQNSGTGTFKCQMIPNSPSHFLLSGWGAGGGSSWLGPRFRRWTGGQRRTVPAGPGVAARRAHQPDREPLPPKAVRGGRPGREAGAGERHIGVHLPRPAHELPRQRRHPPQSAAKTSAGRIFWQVSVEHVPDIWFVKCSKGCVGIKRKYYLICRSGVNPLLALNQIFLEVCLGLLVFFPPCSGALSLTAVELASALQPTTPVVNLWTTECCTLSNVSHTDTDFNTINLLELPT